MAWRGFSGIIKSQFRELFWFFIHEVTAAWRLKIDANDSFGNNFVYEPKMAQKEVF